MTSTVTIWRFSDGKPGHDNQTRGLVLALQRLTPVESFDIPVTGSLSAIRNILSGGSANTALLPDPDLLIGAGHPTHIPMLAARYARGGRIIVLMKPSLPAGFFDLCVVPRHDRGRKGPQSFVTQGALNTVQPSSNHQPDRGLIMVGGHSKHGRWDEDRVLEQIDALISGLSGIHWRITNSRRTPASMTKKLARITHSRASFFSVENTNADWVNRELSLAGSAWITEDSISMIYEALTSGTRVGVLRNPDSGDRRAQTLIDENLVLPFDAWQPSIRPAKPPYFDEARRCANYIYSKFIKP